MSGALAIAGCTAPVPADVYVDVFGWRIGDLDQMTVDAYVGPGAIEAWERAPASLVPWCRERVVGECRVVTCERAPWGSGGGGTSVDDPPLLTVERLLFGWSGGPEVVLDRFDAAYGALLREVPAPGVALELTARGGEALPFDIVLPWPGIPEVTPSVVERGGVIVISWSPPPVTVDAVEVTLSASAALLPGDHVVCRADASLGTTSFPATLAARIPRGDASLDVTFDRRVDVPLSTGARMIADVHAGAYWVVADWW